MYQFDWWDYFTINCMGTFKVAEVAATNKVPRIVFASSLTYYGYEPGIPIETPMVEGNRTAAQYLPADAFNCLDIHVRYSQSKVIAENILAYYGLRKVTEVVCLRFGALGPVTSPDRAARAIIWALQAKGPFWYETFNVTDPHIQEVNCDKIQRAGFAL